MIIRQPCAAMIDIRLRAPDLSRDRAHLPRCRAPDRQRRYHADGHAQKKRQRIIPDRVMQNAGYPGTGRAAGQSGVEFCALAARLFYRPPDWAAMIFAMTMIRDGTCRKPIPIKLMMLTSALDMYA